MKRFLVALSMAVIYLVVGNVITIEVVHNSSNELMNCVGVELLFAPYAFVVGLSEFAGWDSLSYILEAIIFFISIFFFYSLLVVVSHFRR